MQELGFLLSLLAIGSVGVRTGLQTDVTRVQTHAKQQQQQQQQNQKQQSQMHVKRSCRRCQSSVEYENTKTTQHALWVSETSLRMLKSN